MEKDYIWNISTCSYENEKYSASIMNDSTTVCGEIIDVEETKTIPKNVICKTQSFYILLAFLLITIALLIVFTLHY